MNPLILHLKTRHYLNIRDGKKTSEYREFKPYWQSRIKAEQDKIIFVLGYTSDNCWHLKANIKHVSLVIFEQLPKHAQDEFKDSSYSRFFKIDFELDTKVPNRK